MDYGFICLYKWHFILFVLYRENDCSEWYYCNSRHWIFYFLLDCGHNCCILHGLRANHNKYDILISNFKIELSGNKRPLTSGTCLFYDTKNRKKSINSCSKILDNEKMTEEIPANIVI